MNVYQLHVDTATLSTPVFKNTGNPFDCTYLFSQTHRRVRAVRLRNVQMPIGFYNIRAPYNSIIIDGTTYTLTPGNYSTITSLLSALNTLVTAGVGVFTVDPVVNRVIFTSANASGTITIPTVNSTYPTVPTYETTGTGNSQSTSVIGTVAYSTYPGLGYILGFTTTQSGKPITATRSFNIAYDSYVHVFLQNLAPSSLEATQSTFKVPITSTFGGTQNTDFSANLQTVIVTDSAYIVDRLQISVLDRWGNIINNNGLDWSFTLEVISDT